MVQGPSRSEHTGPDSRTMFPYKSALQGVVVASVAFTIFARRIEGSRVSSAVTGNVGGGASTT